MLISVEFYLLPREWVFLFRENAPLLFGNDDWSTECPETKPLTWNIACPQYQGTTDPWRSSFDSQEAHSSVVYFLFWIDVRFPWKIRVALRSPFYPEFLLFLRLSPMCETMWIERHGMVNPRGFCHPRVSVFLVFSDSSKYRTVMQTKYLWKFR